ncbi:NDR1/HIN1-like protein 10 [Phragmites australis]|uniref:NDR1/HIN1-like protein 10 n=1 Tax=Phragmites australis TaxID=29695 RepID=UPI002D78E36D|nr:NDR1/HIN1-like protein 10 [Phragmites australis]
MGKLDDYWDDCCYKWDEWKYCLACIGIVAVVVLFAVLLAAFGFVRHINVTIDDASLTRFELVTTPVTALAYNLSLTLTIRNPNWAMSLKNTKPLVATYKFDEQMFDRVQLADKGDKHPPGKTRVYHLATSSNSSYAALGNAGEVEYRKENATGVFKVEVALTGEVRYTARHTKCKIEASCPLKLQLAPPGTAAVVFEKVKCKLAKAEKNC